MFLSRLAFVGVVTTLCVFLYACNAPEYLSEKELSTFIIDEDNGLSKSIISNDIKVTVTYRPTDLLASQELRTFPEVTAQQILDARVKYQDHYYFLVSLSRSNNELIIPSSQGLSSFSDLLNTISFHMADIAKLTTSGQDTIPVADYIYNRTFGMSNSTDLLFVFEKPKTQNHRSISFNLDEFGVGIGKQSFEFNAFTLESAPKIYKP
jgi:hypothetical protein